MSEAKIGGIWTNEFVITEILQKCSKKLNKAMWATLTQHIFVV